MKQIQCQIKGRVQGVMFRDFVKRNALKLGLFGFVKNMEDGSVSVVVKGSNDKILILVEKLKEGSILSKVEEVVVEDLEPQLDFDSFKIVY